MTDLAALLRDRHSLETEAAAFRKTKAALASLVHNPAYDYETRKAFAKAAGIPAPVLEPTP